jgi:GxxExxY protein
MTHIVHKDESFKVMGACFEVYKLKGCGFTEPVYQECLALEFTLQEIPFVPQPILELEYKGARLTQTLRPDFICYDKIVVELKALPFLIDLNKAQVINYLNATKYLLALLVNFGHYPRLEWERFVNERNRVIADPTVWPVPTLL